MYVLKVQVISYRLRSSCSSYGQLWTSFSLLAPRLSWFFLTVTLDHSQNQQSDFRTVILIQLLNKMHVNYIFENDDNISWSKTTFIKFYNYLCFFALLCFNKMFVEYLFLEYLFASSDLFWRQTQPREVFWKKGVLKILQISQQSNHFGVSF